MASSTLEDSDLLALRSEVLASLKTPAILPNSKVDEEEEEDLEALRQAALLSRRQTSKQSQANVTSTNQGQNRNSFKSKFYGHRRARGGNHLMRNCKRSNLIVISTDDIAENKMKPVVSNPTFFSTKDMNFPIMSEESSSPRTNFPKSKGSGRFSRFESDSNSAESDSDSDFDKDGSEYFTYSDERESVRNNNSPCTEIDLSLQGCTDLTNSTLNNSSRNHLDSRLCLSDQVQKGVEGEKSVEQFLEEETNSVTPSIEHKTCSNDHMVSANHKNSEQEYVNICKQHDKTESAVVCKETCTNGSLPDVSTIEYSTINYKDSSKVDSSELDCQKHIVRSNNSGKISFKPQIECEKVTKKCSVLQNFDSMTKGHSDSHKRKREIVLIKPEKSGQDISCKHNLKWDLRMHLTSNSHKKSHLSHSSSSSSSTSSSSDSESSSSYSCDSRTWSGDSSHSRSRSSHSRSPVPALRSVVGEVKQDRTFETHSTVPNLRKEKSLQKESKTSGHSSGNKAIENSDRKITCLLPPVKFKSSSKSRKCEEMPKKLPIHLRLGTAPKHAHRNDKRSSHLLQSGNEKDSEEKTRDTVYTHENSTTEVFPSFTDCSAKFSSQSRHHSRSSSRKHDRKRSSDESPDNRGKRAHYSRKHHESGVRNKKESKWIHRSKGIIQQY